MHLYLAPENSQKHPYAYKTIQGRQMCPGISNRFGQISSPCHLKSAILTPEIQQVALFVIQLDFIGIIRDKPTKGSVIITSSPEGK